ncbi:MAG TPA: hypothetical protein VML75_12900 [Kofleriaceae bacterium]|nr:hypothetical protein [Kofleriaceae bacterium]
MNIEQVKAQAAELLGRFLEPMQPAALAALTEVLRPSPEDYARVFAPEAVETARAGFDLLWLQSPRPKGKPGQTEVRVFAAPASLLTDDNELSRNFPGGYQRIADKLDPHRVWLAWKYLAPGSSTGMAYDGLVWLDDRFAWFPKPWRVLGDG